MKHAVVLLGSPDGHRVVTFDTEKEAREFSTGPEDGSKGYVLRNAAVNHNHGDPIIFKVT